MADVIVRIHDEKMKLEKVLQQGKESELPLVTVITPAYNRADLITETIESVLGQDYSNFEYIVLDDGSSDSTLDVIKRYDGRLRWESHPNMGETRTVNKGLSMAEGEIIGVVNSDDPLLPGAISNIVQRLQQNPCAIVAYPDWQLIDANGEILQKIRCADFVSHADMVRGHHCLPGPGAFFRRKAFEETGGRDPKFRYVGDMDFWFRVGFLGSFLRIPLVLATFRVHGNSTSVCCQTDAMAQEHIHVVTKFFSDNSLPRGFNKIKNEAILNSYHAAACFSGKKNRLNKCKYIFRSFRSCPMKFILKYQYRIIIYFLLLVGCDYSSLNYQSKKIKASLFRWLRIK